MSPIALAPRDIGEPPATLAAVLTLLEESLGGRAAIVAALSQAPKSNDVVYILGLLGDPRHDATPLATLCARGGITAGELLEAYRAGETARMQTMALYALGQHLRAITEDTTAGALRGGDLDERRLALEHKKLTFDLSKMLAKGQGVTVNTTQQVGVFGAAAGGSLEAMQAATDAILYGASNPVVHVEQVEHVEPVVPSEGDAEEQAILEGDWREDLPE